MFDFDLGFEGWGHELALGVVMTIALALFTFPVGFAIGLGVALAKSSDSKGLRFFGEAYTTIFRGLPELLTLFLIYYGWQTLLQNIANGFHLTINADVPPFVAGVVALGLVFGAYSSEVLFSALKNIDAGQIEAGRSFAMSNITLFRRVTAPQMFRLALPGLGNNWLVLLKDTSLVSIIALDDLLRKTEIAIGATRKPFRFFLLACAIYLAFTALSTVILASIEKSAGKGWRKIA